MKILAFLAIASAIVSTTLAFVDGDVSEGLGWICVIIWAGLSTLPND